MTVGAILIEQATTFRQKVFPSLLSIFQACGIFLGAEADRRETQDGRGNQRGA